MTNRGWRTGVKVGNTIYHDGRFVGSCITPGFATILVTDACRGRIERLREERAPESERTKHDADRGASLFESMDGWLKHGPMPQPAHDEGHPHLFNGEFQSDKYPTTPRGKVPLSVNDHTAADLLWEYAERRVLIDPQFSADLKLALQKKGYGPSAISVYEQLRDIGVKLRAALRIGPNEDPWVRIDHLLGAETRDKRTILLRAKFDLTSSEAPKRESAPTLLEKMAADVDRDGPLGTTVLAQAVPYNASTTQGAKLRCHDPACSRFHDIGDGDCKPFGSRAGEAPRDPHAIPLESELTSDEWVKVMAHARRVRLLHNVFNSLGFEWQLEGNRLAIKTHSQVRNVHTGIEESSGATHFVSIDREMLRSPMELDIYLTQSVRDALHRIACHEVDEMILSGDERPFDPHAGPPGREHSVANHTSTGTTSPRPQGSPDLGAPVPRSASAEESAAAWGASDPSDFVVDAGVLTPVEWKPGVGLVSNEARPGKTCTMCEGSGRFAYARIGETIREHACPGDRYGSCPHVAPRTGDVQLECLGCLESRGYIAGMRIAHAFVVERERLVDAFREGYSVGYQEGADLDSCGDIDAAVALFTRPAREGGSDGR